MASLNNLKKTFGKDFDALLISSIYNIIYLTGFNGFSSEEREAYLLITKNNNYIFTDARYSEVVKKIANFKLLEISSKTSFTQILKEIVTKDKIRIIAIEENDLTAAETIKIKKIIRICPDNSTIENLREIKSESEIKNIQKACRLGDKVFKNILSEIKIGISEKEIAKKIEILILISGAEISFRPIVAFGENSSSPHHVSSNRKLKKNEPVLLDFGVKAKGGYCSDMTRTIYFGTATDKFRKMYKTVLNAQTKAINSVKESVAGTNVDKIARNHIVSQGFTTIPHSLGHGIGLQVHEKPFLSPKSKDKLKVGTVFSIEPGIYLPGYGGIRIEDLIVLGKNGPKIITHANRKLIEL
jgi:Xaa-Pro aminopeptidase